MSIFSEKVHQINELLRPGIMIIGEPFSGRATIHRILAKAILFHSKVNGEDGIIMFNVQVIVESINTQNLWPKCLERAQNSENKQTMKKEKEEESNANRSTHTHTQKIAFMRTCS